MSRSRAGLARLVCEYENLYCFREVRRRLGGGSSKNFWRAIGSLIMSNRAYKGARRLNSSVFYFIMRVFCDSIQAQRQIDSHD